MQFFLDYYWPFSFLNYTRRKLRTYFCHKNPSDGSGTRYFSLEHLNLCSTSRARADRATRIYPSVHFYFNISERASREDIIMLLQSNEISRKDRRKEKKIFFDFQALQRQKDEIFFLLYPIWVYRLCKMYIFPKLPWNFLIANLHFFFTVDVFLK